MWAGKAIEALTDDELKQAKQKLDGMAAADGFAKASPAFKTKMGNRPFPNTNPDFLTLRDAINSEIERRK
jgi:hypothetical protein